MNNDDILHEYCVRRKICDNKDVEKPYNLLYKGITVLELMELARQDELKQIIKNVV